MAEQVDYWDAQAASFDQEPDHGLSDPRTRAAWRDLLRRLIPRTGARVADLGCGTDTLAVGLAQEGHRATGVDLSPRMIERARTKAVAAAVDVEWQIGDASDPPLAGRFDAVICRHVLWAMADPAAALGRWIELLDRGGRLVLIEGCWSTGAGLTARETADHLHSHGRDSEVMPPTRRSSGASRSATSATPSSVRPDEPPEAATSSTTAVNACGSRPAADVARPWGAVA